MRKQSPKSRLLGHSSFCFYKVVQVQQNQNPNKFSGAWHSLFTFIHEHYLTALTIFECKRDTQHLKSNLNQHQPSQTAFPNVQLELPVRRRRIKALEGEFHLSMDKDKILCHRQHFKNILDCF